MSLALGTRLGVYEITGPIGAGGMGEVYRARDTKLHRDVAIKVLPELLAADPERRARFEREAKTLASLNHPHIAQIYGLEQSGATSALVMELVEGEDLAERVARGPLPIDEALAIATQIAEALEAAHEQGIVHRDLKPANIKVRPDGTVKVLDFGLAKAAMPDVGVADSPTFTLAATQVGVILGTAAYMAPEQARGKTVDKRADIWAFGCVLYEMLTGQQAFGGENVTDIVAAVVRSEPDWKRLPAGTAPHVRELLRRCLEKDPKRRLRDLGDAAWEPARGGDAAAPAAPPRGRRRFAAAAVAGALLGAGSVYFFAPRTATVSTNSRLAIPFPAGTTLEWPGWPGSTVAISPDGSRVAVTVSGGLVVRRLDSTAFTPVPGTSPSYQPFFSPDGQWVAYFTPSELRKVSVDGGAPMTLVRGLPAGAWSFGSWRADGTIVFSNWTSGLRSVSSDGGAVTALTRPEEEWHEHPDVVAASGDVLFDVTKPGSRSIHLLSARTGETRVVLDNASRPRVLASGHLLFVRDAVLMVARFDAARGSLAGSPVPLPVGAAWDSVRSKAPVAQFAVAATGTLVYAPAADSVPPTKLVWVDREGREQPVIALQAFEPTVALSPDGRHVALAYARGAVARYDVLDLERLTFSTFLESRDNELTSATWSPDGRSLIYPETQVERTHWVRRSVAGNTPAAPFGTMRGSYGAVHGISGDGRYVVGNIVQRETGTDVVIVPTDPEAGGPVAFAATPGEEFSPAISPDGRWIAYVGGEGGGEEVYVAPRSGDGARLTVSSGGGRGPAWSADGRELFFQRGADGGARDAASDLMAVAFDAARPALGVPRKLFSGPYAVGYDMGRTYAVAPDGQRFLMMKANSAQRLSSVNHLVVVQNWFLELNRLR